MKLMTRARYALARWAVKGLTWQYTPTWVSRNILSTSFHSLVHEGVRKNAAVYSCLLAHAFTFPEPPLLVWDGDDDSAKPIPNHPIRTLIKRPNADQGEAALMGSIASWQAAGGNCYLHKLRNGSRRVIGLRPYHDGVMRAVPVGDSDGIGDESGSWISHYLFRRSDGEEIEVPREDIIHIKWPFPDPLDPWRAHPPIFAAAREVDADNEAVRYMSALLQNDATPRTVLTQSPEQALTENERARVRSEWASLNGGDKRGGIAILEAGMSVERLSFNMNELNFAALHDIPEQRICAVLRVPSSVAGLGDDPTYSNSEEAWNRFTRDTRVPLWRSVASQIQAGLADDFGNDVVVRFDLRRVAALQEDENERVQRIAAVFTAGLGGFFESRAAIGLSEQPEPGELFITQLARELVPFRELVGAPLVQTIEVLPNREPARLTAPPTDEGEPVPEPENALADEGVKGRKARPSAGRIGRALQRARSEVARRMEPRVEAYFEILAASVARRAEGSKALEVKALPDVDQLLLPDDAVALTGIFRIFTLEILRASWEVWNQALDVEVAFDETDPAVVAALAQSGTRITGIVETTRAAVRELLEYGAGQGWTLDQLVRGDGDQPGLRDMVAESYKGRARAIARTETAMAQASATASRYAAAGVSRVTILDGGGDDSDDICNQLNGTVQTLEWYQANQIQHPNCVRAAAPAFD
jgi:HK97 family phage portal protein